MHDPVDIIVPSWHHPEYTIACLQAIEANSCGRCTRVIWVDNGSTAEELDQVMVSSLIAPRRVKVERIIWPEQLGFVKATNAGLAVSTAPYVCLLNNDTEVPPLWLEQLLDVFKREPTVGLVGPRSSGTTWQARVPGELVNAEQGYTVLPPERMLAFFCTLIRREVLEQVGYLSERYRLGYGDDDQYCGRAIRAGWRLALRTDVTVKHEHPGTFPDLFTSEQMAAYKAENLHRLEQDPDLR